MVKSIFKYYLVAAVIKNQLLWVLLLLTLLVSWAQYTTFLDWLVVCRRHGRQVLWLGALWLIVAILRRRLRVHDMHSLFKEKGSCSYNSYTL